jgi:glycine/D-amino acid oxidase-like deaminating enzyme
MAEFPEKANVVIIGLGGIVGASVAHHLIERGWDDIVGIDTSAIPTDIGSTSHASDFCYATSDAPWRRPQCRSDKRAAS